MEWNRDFQNDTKNENVWMLQRWQFLQIQSASRILEL